LNALQKKHASLQREYEKVMNGKGEYCSGCRVELRYESNSEGQLAIDLDSDGSSETEVEQSMTEANDVETEIAKNLGKHSREISPNEKRN
jgi:hypothetical protein